MIKETAIATVLATTALSPALAAPASAALTKTASGLQYTDVKPGEGATPKAGQVVIVHYVGTLPDGTKFDSSRDRQQPFEFKLGAGQVIKGWDECIGMKKGEAARLTCTGDYAYGATGFPAWGIGPNATLVFDIEIIKIE